MGADRAVIDPRKLTEYALNPSHPVGGNKARVFEKLGFNQGNAGELMQQLRTGVMENTPIPGKVDQFGARFTVDIPVVGPAGVSEVLGALGLVLPSATRIAPVLTPVAAALLALVMLLAAATHVWLGEAPMMAPSLVLGGLAAFIAWGRFGKAPIAPRG